LKASDSTLRKPGKPAEDGMLLGVEARCGNDLRKIIFIRNLLEAGGKTVLFRRECSLDGLPASGLGLVFSPMRDDYIRQALSKITDPNILINVVSRRVKQLKRGNRPLVESLEKLSPEDIALREIIEEKISFDAAAN
jgi:DNA-directed RNA polymerase subunit omega